jgi:hypothetical protein
LITRKAKPLARGLSTILCTQAVSETFVLMVVHEDTSFHETKQQ